MTICAAMMRRGHSPGHSLARTTTQCASRVSWCDLAAVSSRLPASTRFYRNGGRHARKEPAVSSGRDHARHTPTCRGKPRSIAPAAAAEALAIGCSTAMIRWIDLRRF